MICRNCNGEGYVLDKLAIAISGGMIVILGWLASDGNPKGDLHKQECGRCHGTGREPGN